VEKGRTPSNPSKFLSFFFLFFLFFIWVESFVYGQSVAQQETYIRGNKNSLSRGLCTFFFIYMCNCDLGIRSLIMLCTVIFFPRWQE
jgi:hypothetical protein